MPDPAQTPIQMKGPPADPLPEQPPEQALEADAERLAKETDVILKRINKARVKAWADWMEIADRLHAIAKLAMRLTGTSNRAPGPYVQVMNRLLAKHAFGEQKQLRAALIGIWENRTAVEAMRAEWTADQLLKWQSPRTVWDRYVASLRIAPERDPTDTVHTRLVRMRDERDYYKAGHDELHKLDGMSLAERAARIVTDYPREEARALATAVLALLDAAPDEQA